MCVESDIKWTGKCVARICGWIDETCGSRHIACRCRLARTVVVTSGCILTYPRVWMYWQKYLWVVAQSTLSFTCIEVTRRTFNASLLFTCIALCTAHLARPHSLYIRLICSLVGLGNRFLYRPFRVIWSREADLNSVYSFPWPAAGNNQWVDKFL